MIQRVIFIVLIILAGLSWWALSVQDRQPARQSELTGPDFYMETFNSVVMDAAGLPKNKLVANRMSHYPGDKRTDFTKPEFTVFKPNEMRYTISADTGQLISGTDALLLEGAVQIRRFNHSVQESLITTEQLWVLAEQNLAHTDKPVRFSAQESTVDAVGVKADFINHTLDLFNQVRGKYVSPP